MGECVACAWYVRPLVQQRRHRIIPAVDDEQQRRDIMCLAEVEQAGLLLHGVRHLLGKSLAGVRLALIAAATHPPAPAPQPEDRHIHKHMHKHPYARTYPQNQERQKQIRQVRAGLQQCGERVSALRVAAAARNGAAHANHTAQGGQHKPAFSKRVLTFGVVSYRIAGRFFSESNRDMSPCEQRSRAWRSHVVGESRHPTTPML